ncbi:hypothetical protein HAZT_HAZT011506 [Hyalella azteca]|uniref:G-protein coupled receptors family 3 profile domain-containing protein n=1 Tax=Hyalella azteca TaxID=294128 RepID=A0A6A0GRK3_HYAAZ|nr:hypothetical protein HAZT_HAZT011506 [Hyalella azteca]
MMIVMALVSLEVAINVVWLLLTPPQEAALCDVKIPHKILVCRGIDGYSYMCPGGFDEARYIAFTNYTSCIIWVVFVPLYLSKEPSDETRIVSLAMSLSLCGFVQLGCLFLPKVHFVIFKPDKNTRDAVMSAVSMQYPDGFTYNSLRYQNQNTSPYHGERTSVVSRTSTAEKKAHGSLKPQFVPQHGYQYGDEALGLYGHDSAMKQQQEDNSRGATKDGDVATLVAQSCSFASIPEDCSLPSAHSVPQSRESSMGKKARKYQKKQLLGADDGNSCAEIAPRGLENIAFTATLNRTVSKDAS